MTESRPVQLCLFGASPDTGNLGVSALYWSVVGGLARYVPKACLTVFDGGHGLRETVAEFAAGRLRYWHCGATGTRRVWQRRSLWNVRFSSRLGGLGNPAAERMRHADGVLDITGGDSFTDLYGRRRFDTSAAVKRLVLRLGRRLILLPQTYGPYRDPRHREIAAEICRQATLAWARDERSFAMLRDLAGDAFDPTRHLSGVDVAFALEARRPASTCSGHIMARLVDREVRDREGACSQAADVVAVSACRPVSGVAPRQREIIGLNVSGLIWHDPAAMRVRYGFRADYRAVVLGFLRRILLETDADVLLVPHVLTPPGHYESDPGANEAVLDALRNDADRRVARAADERVAAVPSRYDHPAEMKWIISRCDWFCGMRMHACIAALSSGVPTAGVAYSAKTQGVFETCGVGDAVVDPRALDTATAVEALFAVWAERAAFGERVRAVVDVVCRQAAAPFVDLTERLWLSGLPRISSRSDPTHD